MHTKLFTQFDQLKQDNNFIPIRGFIQRHTQSSFFQSLEFFEFIENVEGYSPYMIVAFQDHKVIGTLLGVIQVNGNGLKSWMSRRLIVWGGPLAQPEKEQKATELLLTSLHKTANGRAIYVEFRNFFDTSHLKKVFNSFGFEYKPHLNYLVRTDEQSAVKKRMSSSRWRQIKSSLKAGAEIAEPDDEAEVIAFYNILQKLYKEKVKKPLPSIDMFIKFWQSDICKFFLVKYESKVVGGIVCPIFDKKVIYEWYVCGEDGQIKGLHPSVLATWAPIEYALKNGFDHFDFMGAGKPEQDYGVREFKARFGGEEVCYGRYEMIVNKALYTVGKLGLQVYQKLT